MKRIHLLALMLALLPTVLWGGSSNYYAEAQAKCGNGCGKVYAATSATSSPEYTTDSSTSAKQGGSDKSSTAYKFYVYAQNKHGYKFKSWSTTPEITDTQTSNNGTATISNATTEKGALVTVTTGSYSFGNNGGTQTTTAAVTATYEECTDDDAHYTLTLGNNLGLGAYTVSGPVDFPSIAPGGSVKVWFNDVVTFSVTPADGYDFVRWCWDDADGMQYFTDASLSNKSFTSDTTISAEFKQQVECKAICLASEGGSYKVNETTVSGNDHTESKFASISVTLSEPVADDGYEFYGWYILYSNGVKGYISYFTEASTGEYSEDITIGAEFRRKGDVTLTFQPADNVAYTVEVTDTVDGSVVTKDFQAVGSQGKEVSLAITEAIDWQPRWWYKTDEFGEKIYFSYLKSVSKTFTENAIVGVDMVYSENSLAKALADAADGDTITLSDDFEVVYGTSITIPSGVTVVVPEGKTLYVDGSLTVEGTLTIYGSISKCLKIITQSGLDGLMPLNPYGSVKYWKSEKAVASDASINGWDGTFSSHLTVMRGDGIAVRGEIDDKTQMVKCTFGTNAVNHVTAIVEAYDTNSITNGNSYILLSDATINGPKSTVSADTSYDRIDNHATIDCAGNACTMGNKQISSNNACKILNASSFSYNSSYWQNGSATFYNCPSISIKPVKGTPPFYLYDSGKTLEFTQNSSGTAKCMFYSGMFDADLDNAAWLSSSALIYGGAFKTKPNDKWIESTAKKTRAFCQHADGYWYLDVNQDPSVAKIGANSYYTIEAALEYLEENDSATLTLLCDITLDSPYTLENGKNLVVELNGYHINAPTGFMKNHGTLSIRDNDNKMLSNGITSDSNAYIVENYADGKVDICYGVYDGNFLNSGTFTTHHGKFIGDLENNEGEMNLKGGVFLSNVSELVNEGYHAFLYNGWYYVGLFPEPILSEGGAEYGEFSHTMLAMSPEDALLYRTNKFTSLDDMSVENWKKVAEMKAAYQLFEDEGFYFDILLGFDREIAADSVCVKVKTKIGTQSGYVSHMDAGVLERVFSPRITQTKISYARFIYDNGEGNYDNMEAGVSNETDANIGTTCTLAMDLWKYREKAKINQDSYLTIVKKSYVFGAGSNVAMLQTESGAVPEENFFATLAAAIESEATSGNTIKLCNDCAENVTVGKECTIDVNGFEFTGSVAAAEGYEVSSAGDGVYVVTAVVTDPVEKVNTNASELPSEWLEANNLTAESTEEEVKAKLEETDTNGNAKWQNLVLGQDGDEDVAIVTSTNGTATAAEIAVTFSAPENTGYTLKYAFDQTDRSGAVTNASETAQESPTLDLTNVTTDAPSYYKMRAVLVSEDENVTTNVAVDKTIGVMKVESTAEYTILAVPWVSLDSGDVKASELVHAASLSDGDELIAYSGDGTSFNKWTVKSGVWAKSEESELDENGNVTETNTPEPGSVGLSRGKGVWLKRQNPDESPIYLIGQPSTEDVETALTAAAASTDGKQSWNLVASPSAQAVDVTDIFGSDTADRIIVPTGANTAPKNFHYSAKKAAWGYDSTEIVKDANGNVLGVRAVFKTDDTTVPAGTGFWYLNSSTDEDKKITW